MCIDPEEVKKMYCFRCERLIGETDMQSWGQWLKKIHLIRPLTDINCLSIELDKIEDSRLLILVV